MSGWVDVCHFKAGSSQPSTMVGCYWWQQTMVYSSARVHHYNFMILGSRSVFRFVIVNLRPTAKSEMRKMTWQELLFSSNMHSQYNIPRILKGEPRVEALHRDLEIIDPNEEWYLADMLKLMSLLGSENYFSASLLEDLHRTLVRYSNIPEFLQDDIFYSLSEFLDVNSNIPLLKSARLQAYSRMYDRLDPFQREILLRDYLETHRTGEFLHAYIQDSHKPKDFTPKQLPNRNTAFEFVFLQLKNTMDLEIVIQEEEYWTPQRLARFEKLLDKYLLILENPTTLSHLVSNYQCSTIFLPGLNVPNKTKILDRYKERLFKIIDMMHSPEHHGLLLPKDEQIESVIMANFSRNDRALLRPVLEKICELSIKRFPNTKASTMLLMEFCSFVHKGFLHLSFLSYKNKMRSIRQMSRQISYKYSREVLQVGVAMYKLKFREALKDLVDQESFKEFLDLYVMTLRSFIFTERNTVSSEETIYRNILPEKMSNTKLPLNQILFQSRLPESISKLVHQERSLSIVPSYEYIFDLRLESELPPLSIFVLHLEALEASLSMSGEEFKFGATAFREMSNTIVQMKTVINYVCLPRVFESIIRLKILVKTKLKDMELNIIDNETSKRIKKEINHVWNNLESFSKSMARTFRHDPRYNYNLFDIDPSLVPPLLNCGKSSPVVHNHNNINFVANFTCNDKNILQNVYTNKLLPILYEPSELKTVTESYLKTNGVRYSRNLVDYPYFADFFVEYPEKTVIYCVDYTKLYMGSPNITIRDYDDSVSHFKGLKYHVINVTYKDLQNGRLEGKVLESLSKLE